MNLYEEDEAWKGQVRWLSGDQSLMPRILFTVREN